MRVIHSLGWYFPDSTGGTEVYVSQLIRALKAHGVESVVAAAREGDDSDSYTHEGINVFRYPVHAQPNLKQVRGTAPYGGFSEFSNWLPRQQADVYHQHSFVGGCGIHHLRAARELGLPTVVTVHLPSTVCLRGTMMLHGKSACDGRVERVRCGVCWGTSRGIPRPMAEIAGRLPLALSKRAEKSDRRASSVLATPALVGFHLDRLAEVSTLADRIIAISQWLYDALLINGIPKEKLVLCQTGGPASLIKEIPHRTSPNGHLRLGFLGRWDKLKGIDLLVQAVRNLPPRVPIKLVIHGLPGKGAEAAFELKVRRLAAGDARIEFAGPVKPEDIPGTLSKFDLLAIPSQLLETGPLVALEAHAAGVPIIASDLGGLSEKVRHGEDGWLVPAADIRAWTSAFLELAENRKLVARLQEGIRPVRTMDEVASDMVTVYDTILEEQTGGAQPIDTSIPRNS
jgi:glycosyltransferase involved in cell wall biosynthesis